MCKPDMCETLYLKMGSRWDCGLVPRYVRFWTIELVVVFYIVWRSNVLESQPLRVDNCTIQWFDWFAFLIFRFVSGFLWFMLQSALLSSFVFWNNFTVALLKVVLWMQAVIRTAKTDFSETWRWQTACVPWVSRHSICSVHLLSSKLLQASCLVSDFYS